MMNVIERRPFSELGDQQLLEQTRRLAANQRCLEVHILDHLDEIDRRGLALRRGFSSLFDYAVRELRFSDAAAQRRIQAMRLCRRHGWVRASLQSGELSMTAAAQLEATFAGAERAERQSCTGRWNVGPGRCRDQDHDSAGGTRQLGLPAAPGEADEQEERGHRSAPGFTPPAAECSGDVRERRPGSAPGLAPRAEQCAGDAGAVNPPVVPVASHAVAQDRGAGHASAPLPDLIGSAVLIPASSCDPEPAPAAPASDEDPAPQPLPPTDLPAPAHVPAPASVVAPSESRHPASRTPEPPRDDPFVQLSPGTVSAAPLLHPQRQRELIEQAAGMSTRQVASLLAAAAPEVVPPRDTLRAAAPDRYTLKVSIDQECEQGLRLLKDLMSHVDPRMSWGHLVARLVRDAVARHDPRGGARGQRRRRSAGSAGASPRRAPIKTRAAGAEAGPVQPVGETSGRAPNKTRAAMTPAAPARRGGGGTPAPKGDTAATAGQNPVAMLASAAAPQQSAPAALADGALAGGVPSAAPAATAAPQFAGGVSADGSNAGAGVPVSPGATSAPQLAADVSVDGSHPGAGAQVSPGATSAPQSAAGASADGSHPGAGAQVSPVATSAPQLAADVSVDGSHPGAGAPISPGATSAPQPAADVSVDGSHPGAGAPISPGATSAPQPAADVSVDGSHPGAGAPISPGATSAPQPTLGGSPDGGPPGATAGAAAHTTREPVHRRHHSPPRRHIPAAVRRHIWLRDGGRCCYRDPLSGRRCTSSHLLQIDHLLPVAQGGGPDPSNLNLLCAAHHRMRHGYGPAAPPEPPL